MLLAVFVGSGVQVLCMTVVTLGKFNIFFILYLNFTISVKIDCIIYLAFACLGFLSPANRGSLMTCSLVLFVSLGTPAGYVSSRIYKSFGGDKWKSNIILTSMFCPG